MVQPDRGALSHIHFTGPTRFEIRSIPVHPRGFRVLDTKTVARHSASVACSYRVERYRYEYSRAYGSPQLDRTSVSVERVGRSDDRRCVELTRWPLVEDWVHL